MRRLLAVVVGFFALLAPVLVAVSSPSLAVGEASGGVFVPVTPFRLAYTANGTGGYATPIGAGVTRSYTVAGVGGVPSSGVSAVVIDIAATKATVADTALRVWAKGEPMPTTSSILRFGGSDPMVSNTAIVPLGTGGGISIWNNHGLTDYNIDVQGYFTTESDASSTGGFVAFDAPVRVMNSLAGLGSPDPRLTAGTSYDVQVTGDDIPADATAVFVNVKVDTDSGSSGGLQIGEGGTTISGLPAAVNYVGGNKWSDTGLAVKLSTDGKLRIRNATAGGTPAVYIDVQGYFSGDPDEGGSYTPVTQVNLGQVSIAAQDSVTFQAADIGELPDAETLGSVALTVFAYNWSAFGSVRVYNPDGEEPDNRGNVTFNTTMNSTTGATSTALVQTSTDGEIAVLNTSTQPVSVRLITQGWFTSTREDELPDDDDPVAPQDPGELCNDPDCAPRLVAGVASASVDDVQVFVIPPESDDLDVVDSSADYLTLDDAETTMVGDGFEVGISPEDVPGEYASEHGVIDVFVAVTTSSGTEIGSVSAQAVIDPSDPETVTWVDPSNVDASDDQSDLDAPSGTAAARAITLDPASAPAASSGSLVSVIPDVVQVTEETSSTDDESLDRPGATDSHVATNTAVGPTTTCSDTYKKSKVVNTVVGTSYPVSGATGRIVISKSSGGNYGLALSSTGTGSWTKSSVRFRKTTGWSASFAASKAQRSYRIGVQYKQYKVSCLYVGPAVVIRKAHYEWRPTAETGGATYVDRLKRPNWTKCTPLSPNVEWSRKNSSGRTYSHSTGVKFKGLIGIDLQTSREYTTTSKLVYKNSSKTVKLCGNNDWPSNASKVMLKK